MWLIHYLSPFDSGSWSLSRLPAEGFIEVTGSAIEAIIADFIINHPGFHPDTLIILQG